MITAFIGTGDYPKRKPDKCALCKKLATFKLYDAEEYGYTTYCTKHAASVLTKIKKLKLPIGPMEKIE